MTGRQLTKWRRAHGLTLEAMGAIFGLDKATLSRYENELLEIPKPVELAVAFTPLAADN